MQVVSIIELIVLLLQGTATALGKAGLAKEAEGITAAITKLMEVQGTLVTKSQVDSLRITPQW